MSFKKVLLSSLVMLMSQMVVGEEFDIDKEYETLTKSITTKNYALIQKTAIKILSKNDKDLKALNGLAMFHSSKGQLGLAKVIINRGIDAHPKEPSFYNNLGVIYLNEGEKSKALSAFRSAIKIKSNYKYAGANLSSIFLEYRDFKKALSPLEEAYDLVKSDLSQDSLEAIKVANNYAVALMGSGKGKEARDVFKKLFSANVSDAKFLLNYAILLVVDLKDKKAAYKVISKMKFLSDDSVLLKKANELEKMADKL